MFFKLISLTTNATFLFIPVFCVVISDLDFDTAFFTMWHFNCCSYNYFCCDSLGQLLFIFSSLCCSSTEDKNWPCFSVTLSDSVSIKFYILVYTLLNFFCSSYFDTHIFHVFFCLVMSVLNGGACCFFIYFFHWPLHCSMVLASKRPLGG